MYNKKFKGFIALLFLSSSLLCFTGCADKKEQGQKEIESYEELDTEETAKEPVKNASDTATPDDASPAPVETKLENVSVGSDGEIVVDTKSKDVTISSDDKGNQIASIKTEDGDEIKVVVKTDEKTGQVVIDDTKTVSDDGKTVVVPSGSTEKEQAPAIKVDDNGNIVAVKPSTASKTPETGTKPSGGTDDKAVTKAPEKTVTAKPTAAPAVTKAPTPSKTPTKAAEPTKAPTIAPTKAAEPTKAPAKPDPTNTPAPTAVPAHTH